MMEKWLLNINKNFYDICFKNNYFISSFTGKKYKDFNNLRIFHILDDTDELLLRKMKKNYKCSSYNIVKSMLNIPLLNTFIGHKVHDAKFNKIENVKHIDRDIIRLIFFQKEIPFYFYPRWHCSEAVSNLHSLILSLKNDGFINREKLIRYQIEEDTLKNMNYDVAIHIIKDIQLKFHKEINN